MQTGHLTFLDFAVIIVFFLLMIGVGVFYARRKRNSDEYFGGDKSVPWYLAGVSYYMGSFSALAFVMYSALGHWLPCLREMIQMNAITTVATLLGMAWGTWWRPDSVSASRRARPRRAGASWGSSAGRTSIRRRTSSPIIPTTTGTPVSPDETLEILAFLEAGARSRARGGAAVSVAETLEAAHLEAMRRDR